MNDDSIGVVFNDMTKLLLLADGHNIHYIDYESNEHYYTMTEYPGTVEKKVKLLNYFKNYMKEHLLKAGANMEVGNFRQLISVRLNSSLEEFSPIKCLNLNRKPIKKISLKLNVKLF